MLVKLDSEKKWVKPGEIIDVDPLNRSYLVKMDSGTVRRSGKHLQRTSKSSDKPGTACTPECDPPLDMDRALGTEHQHSLTPDGLFKSKPPSPARLNGTQEVSPKPSASVSVQTPRRYKSPFIIKMIDSLEYCQEYYQIVTLLTILSSGAIERH